MIHPRAFNVRLLVVLLVAIAIPGSVHGADPGSKGREVRQPFTVPDALAERGIESYRLDVEGSFAEVELLAPGQARLGSVRLSYSIEEGTLVELDQPEAQLLLLFHPLAGEIKLTDLRTQRTATGILTNEGWQIDEESRHLLELYADEIAIMSEVHDDVYFNHVQGEGLQKDLEATFLQSGLQKDLDAACLRSEPPGEKIYEPCEVICNGPQVRGQSLVGASKSSCCAAARADANLQCWNQHCTGCCSFWSCDAFCLVGDYLCAPCGITGRSCSGRNCPSPIIVDLDGGGFDLTGTSDPVSFDIDADGELDSISWTAATSGDAFLALDLNGNGLIDNGGELFGNFTVDQVAAEEPNGYAALAVYDQVRSTGNRDGFITAEDGWIFDALLLWIDSSHDGVSQPEELSPLSHFGITALDLDYKTSRGRDGFGNGFRYFSFAHFADNTRTKTVDVFFRRATSD